MSTPSILILPGDGIGPEVMAEVRKVIDWYGAKRNVTFDVSEDLVGGAAYDAHGTPLHTATGPVRACGVRARDARLRRGNTKYRYRNENVNRKRDDRIDLR